MKIDHVNSDNVEQHGFFCYKSKRKSDGYQRKLAWLRNRFDEGMQIKILSEGKRSFGFIEYIPGEYTWRVVDAPNYLVIHCLWVVGQGKGKGYGSHLLQLCLDDARTQGKAGVVMVSSRGNWLATEKLFVKHGFEKVDSAPPSFQLLVHQFENTAVSSAPAFPTDWDARLAAHPTDATILYANQCPYMPDAVQGAVDVFAERGISTNVVELPNCTAVRAQSPTPYGIFAIIYAGQLLTYHYLGKKEIKRLDTLLADS